MPNSNIELPIMTFGKAFGFLIGVFGLGSIIVTCWIQSDMVTSLSALVGACLGWLVGIIVAPLSLTERENFNVIAKIISGFITGYLLSKIDPLITMLFTINLKTGMAPVAQPEIAVKLLVTLASFLVAVLLVFNARSYWSVVADKLVRDAVAAAKPNGGDTGEVDRVS